MVFERIKTVKGHQYKYEVESVRENGKIKQKIVKYLGRVDKPEVSLTSFLKKSTIKVVADNGQITIGRPHKGKKIAYIFVE